MSSNLWYKYRLLVLGSITYTLKPFSSEDSCLRVISSSWETWKTRPGLWEQLTELWREAIGFLLLTPFLVGTTQPAWPIPVNPQAPATSSSQPSSQFRSSSASPRTLNNFLSWYTSVFVSQMWSFRTKLLESISYRLFQGGFLALWTHSMTLKGCCYMCHI